MAQGPQAGAAPAAIQAEPAGQPATVTFFNRPIINGLIKSFAFAIVIGVVCCHQGLSTIGGPRGIPVPLIIMLVVFVFTWWVMAFTAFGRYIYASGGNPEASRMLGIPVDRGRLFRNGDPRLDLDEEIEPHLAVAVGLAMSGGPR